MPILKYLPRLGLCEYTGCPGADTNLTTTTLLLPHAAQVLAIPLVKFHWQFIRPATDIGFLYPVVLA